MAGATHVFFESSRPGEVARSAADQVSAIIADLNLDRLKALAFHPSVVLPPAISKMFTDVVPEMDRLEKLMVPELANISKKKRSSNVLGVRLSLCIRKTGEEYEEKNCL